MAEFKNQLAGFPNPEVEGTDGFAAMGKPIPFYRRQAGYEHARQMGVNEDSAFSVICAMCDGLERDEPYTAMGAGMKHVDLTGTYRLMAVLLTAEPKTT